MKFLSGFKKSPVYGGLQKTVDYNKDGKRGFGEWLRFGAGAMANPYQAAGRVAYNTFQNNQGRDAFRNEYATPYQRQQFQLQQPLEVKDFVNRFDVPSSGLSSNPNDVPRQPMNDIPPVGNVGAPRPGFNFMGAPAMGKADYNALFNKSEAANYVNDPNSRIINNNSVSDRFNVLGGHEAMIRKLNMAKYLGELNPTAAYGDAQFQQEWAMKNAGLQQ